MKEKPVQRDMEITELLDELEKKLAESKRHIADLNKQVELMEHEAGIYMEVIEQLHKIALEG